MIFIDNKYTFWYFNIINNARSRETTGYIEKHHIIPKSCGGNNTKENIVKLTAREHFVCHLLLTKMVDDQFRHKMVYAFHGLRARQSRQENRTDISKINSKLYKKLKEELSEIKRAQIPWNKGLVGAQIPWNKGIPMSETTKQKIKQARSKQDMSYRKGVKMSEDQKQKISDALKGNIPWNKGMTNIGIFSDPEKNPMKNPISIQKMLDTRRKNKENKSRN